MPFDPSQPFEIVDVKEPSTFDPSKPFEVVDPPNGNSGGFDPTKPFEVLSEADAKALSVVPGEPFMSAPRPEADADWEQAMAEAAGWDRLRDSGPVTALIGKSDRQRAREAALRSITGATNGEGNVKDRMANEGLAGAMLNPWHGQLARIPKTGTILSDSKVGQVVAGTFNAVMGLDEAIAAPVTLLGGVARGGTEIVKGLGAVPELANVVSKTAPMLPAVNAVERTASAAFGLDMLGHAPGQVSDAVDAFSEGDLQGAVEGGVGAAVGGLLGVGAARHAISDAGPMVNAVADEIGRSSLRPEPSEVGLKRKGLELQLDGPPRRLIPGDVLRPVSSESDWPNVIAESDATRHSPVDAPKAAEVPFDPSAPFEVVDPPPVPALEAAPSESATVVPPPADAVAEPTPPGEADPTALKREVVDAQRAQEGRALIPVAERPSFDEELTTAREGEAAAPGMGRALVDNLLSQADPQINRQTSVQLLAERMRLRNQRAGILDRLRDSSLSDPARLSLQEEWARTTEQMDRVDQASRRAGTTWSDIGRAYQRVLNSDFTIDEIERRMGAAKGAPLSPEEVQQVEGWAAEHKAAQEALAKREAQLQEREAALAAERSVVGLERAAPYSPEVLTLAERIVNRLDAAADAARDRLRAKMSRTSSGIDPTILADLAIVGASKLARATIDFAKWSESMTGEFGDFIKPVLADLWTASHRQLEKEDARTGPKIAPKVKQARTAARDNAADRVGILEGIRAAKVEGAQIGGDLDQYVKKLAKNLVEGGVRGMDNVIGAVHGMLAPDIPGLTRRQVMDAFSDYGKSTPAPTDPIRVHLAEIRSEAQKTSALEDVIEKRKAPAATGRQRTPLSDIARRLVKQLNEAKKRFNIAPTDPATALKSALDSRKTYYRNRITDLAYEIARRERVVREKSTGPTDPELEILKADYAKAKEEHAAIFGRTEMTPESRLKVALAAAERSAMAARDALKRAQNGDFSIEPKKGAPVDSPELAKIRAEARAARDQVAELRKIQKAIVGKDQEAALRATIKRQEDRLATADPREANRPATVDTETLQTLKAKAKDLSRQWREALRAGRKPIVGDDPAARLQAQIRAVYDRINRGDYRKKPGEVTVDTAEVIGLRNELRYARAQLDELIHGPRPTPEEVALAQYMARLSARELDLQNRQARIAAGDTSVWDLKPRGPSEAIGRDPEVQAARKRINQLKAAEDAAKAAFERSKRTRFQRLTESIKQLNRGNVLGHVSSLEHLAGAAIENIVSRPLGTAVAQLMRFNRTLDSIRRKAVYEGHVSVASERANLHGIARSLPEVWRKLREGHSGLDWMHNEGRVYPKELLQWVGHIHGAIKEPVRQGIYGRSLELRVRAAEAAGLNPATDRILWQTLSNEAYVDANADIMMGDNFLTSAIHKQSIAMLRGEKHNPALANFTADVLEILFPVVNVTTNIAIRKFRLAAGIPEAALRIGHAAARGELKNDAEKLSHRDAEVITRSLKYGITGLALAIYAWNHPEQFGGLYVPGQQAPRDRSTGLKIGEIRLPGGVFINHHFAHGPLGGHLNLVADARRLYDQKQQRSPDSKWSNLTDVGAFGMMAGLRDIPMFGTVSRLASPYRSAAVKMGEMVRNMFVIGIAQDAAKWMDNDTERVPKNFIQAVQVGIPGLRSGVPEKMGAPR